MWSPLLLTAACRGRGTVQIIDKKIIKAIVSILEKGDRAEVIPTRDGPKVVRITREPVK